MQQQEKAKKPVDPNFPKWKYAEGGKSKMVHSKQEEAFLGEKWKDSPIAFGEVTHPHSDDYLARLDAKVDANGEPPFDEEIGDGVEAQADAGAPKKRGRKPKEG